MCQTTGVKVCFFQELVTTPIVTNVCTESLLQKESKETKLEPFPFKPEPVRPKRKVPPPPSPSRFVKGEFRESDYESDYEGRIPPIWRVGDSDGEPAYRPVRPNLTPGGRISQTSARTPTPPSEFDNPPQIAGPPRPKFEPIEKPKPSVKFEDTRRHVPKPVVFKPKPVTAVKPETEVVVATPAVPDKVVVLEPGSPPEIGFAPGPKKTQYYRSTTSAPYQNAVQTETSNVMHFNESTEHCRRTVSLQQTTKVIKFGDQTKTEQYGSGVPRPKKFVPGEFRESDYESEVEGARIRPKWAPSGSDTEEPHYRKVRAPAAIRSSSVPASRERVLTPMEFDTQPVYRGSAETRTDYSKQISRTERQYGDKNVQYSRSQSLESRRPEAYDAQKFTRSAATKIASQHMDSMTHDFKSKTKKFVNDIIGDVNKQATQKPILKVTDDADAQVYREESRAAQYGKPTTSRRELASPLICSRNQARGPRHGPHILQVRLRVRVRNHTSGREQAGRDTHAEKDYNRTSETHRRHRNARLPRNHETVVEPATPAKENFVSRQEREMGTDFRERDVGVRGRSEEREPVFGYTMGTVVL